MLGGGVVVPVAAGPGTARLVGWSRFKHSTPAASQQFFEAGSHGRSYFPNEKTEAERA